MKDRQPLPRRTVRLDQVRQARQLAPLTAPARPGEILARHLGRQHPTGCPHCSGPDDAA